MIVMIMNPIILLTPNHDNHNHDDHH